MNFHPILTCRHLSKLFNTSPQKPLSTTTTTTTLLILLLHVTFVPLLLIPVGSNALIRYGKPTTTISSTSPTSTNSIQLIYSSPKFPLNIVVGLPSEEGNLLRNPFHLTIGKAQPVFDVAIEDIYHKRKLLPKDSLRITYADTQLSDAIGPQKIVDAYCNRSVDAVMGLAYVYALAPVARMSQYWADGVPVFSTSAMVDELGDKDAFPLLTRLMGSYRSLAFMVLSMVRELGWRQFHFFFNDQSVHGPNQGRSECFFALNAIKNAFKGAYGTNMSLSAEMFSEQTAKADLFTFLLKKASLVSNSKHVDKCFCLFIWDLTILIYLFATFLLSTSSLRPYFNHNYLLFFFSQRESHTS